MGQRQKVVLQYLFSSFSLLEVFSLAHGYPESWYSSQPCLQLDNSHIKPWAMGSEWKWCLWLLRCTFFLKKILFIYFLEGREGREKERERNMNEWLLLTHPLLGTWPVTQARAPTGNRTGDPLVLRLVLNPLSCTSQGWAALLKEMAYSFPLFLLSGQNVTWH